MNRIASKRAGFTLIEILISVTVIGVTLGSVIMSMGQGAAAWQSNMAAGTLDAKTERTLSRIIRYLESASGDNIQPDLGLTPLSSWIDFQEITGYGGGAVSLSETSRIQLEIAPGEIDNGADDNGNGLIDECRVVLIRDPGGDETQVVIANGIREYLEGETGAVGDENGNGLFDEPGLCFDLEGNTLNIRITLEKVGPSGRLLTRTLEGSITLLN